jgi:hypothetical protein
LSGAAGFGYAATFLTEHREAFGATIDQAGLAVFFLQRHRAELTLKALLDSVGADVTGEHRLRLLWDECKAALEPRDPPAWRGFDRDHHELVQLLDSVDERSMTFRYPVDRAGNRFQRPAFIDLDALNDHVDKLFSAASGYVDFLHLGA